MKVRLGLVLGACLGCSAALADTLSNPSTEYLNRIKTAETVEPLGATPFGESISLYTGALGFKQTDISYPGVGPAIVLSRTYSAGGSPLSYTNNLPFADWDLAAPRIRTIVAGEGVGLANQGVWVVEGSNPTARCTQFGPIAGEPAYSIPWWHGYQLETGDGGSQPLLMRTSENTLAPGANPSLYPAVTPSHWMLSCLATDAAGAVQETFLATAPDGTRYWFNRLQYGRSQETLIEQVTDTLPRGEPLFTSGHTDTAVSDDDTGEPDIYWGIDNIKLFRRIADMQATRVEDRFGNWVTYTYGAAGQLQEINASDGRRVVVSYRTDIPAFVDRITVQPDSPQPRVWQYIYATVPTLQTMQLQAVVQPDGSSWTFQMNLSALQAAPSANPENYCNVRTYTQQPSQDNVVVVSMTHPSGLQGQFLLSLRAHGRSYVPTICAPQTTNTPPTETVPTVYLSLSLTSRTFSGPGLSPATWQYAYSTAHASTIQECAAQACPDSQWSEVIDPEGGITHYKFSNRWDASEGRLLEVTSGVSQPGADNPVGLQLDRSTFVNPMQGPFPSRLGLALDDADSASNTAPSEVMQMESLHETTRQGVTFSRRTNSFDRFGQPESVTRSSTLGYSTSESTTYWPVSGTWVLGQVAKVTAGAGVLAQTDYDERMLPLRSYEFGLLKSSYWFNTDGSLRQVTDAMGHATQLDAYARGIPQRITFADASTEQPAVDEFGQVTGVTNQLGDRTAYRYDVMGRVARIDYPTGDSVAWTPTLRNFTYVANDEYGIPSGHWKQSIATGNGVTTNYYDAMWRPVLAVSEDAGNALSRTFVVNRFDGTGRKVFSSYPVGSLGSITDALNGVTTIYDALGRVSSTRQDSELGTLTASTEYLSGFTTRVTNARGYQTTTSFQVFDAPSEEFPVRIEAPLGVLTTISRDVFNKPLQITRSGPGS